MRHKTENDCLSDLLLDAMWYHWMGMDDKARQTLVRVASAIPD